jgi:type II secretory pathway pseudopilin PulG
VVARLNRPINSRKQVKPQRSNRWGFTLLELLTVIIIIVLLASMIIPTMAGLRARADRGKCMSNLRQLYVAASGYVDSQGHWPQVPPAEPLPFELVHQAQEDLVRGVSELSALPAGGRDVCQEQRGLAHDRVDQQIDVHGAKRSLPGAARLSRSIHPGAENRTRTSSAPLRFQLERRGRPGRAVSGQPRGLLATEGDGRGAA